MPCILCGENNFRFLSKKLRDVNNLTVQKCDKCKLIQLKPTPSNENIKKYYNQTKISIESIKDKKYKDKKILSQEDTDRRIKLVSRYIHPGENLLDYGFGYGFFLKEMKRKYNCYGVELSDIRLKTAQQIMDIPLFNNTSRLKNNFFNVITLFHVLEHLTNPVSLLRTLNEKLKDNGTFIIEVPNVDDYLLKINLAYKNFYWKKAHISYFNKKTLIKSIKDSGLRVIDIIYVQRWNIFNFMNWVVRNSPQPTNEIIKLLPDQNFKWLNNFYKQYLITRGISDTIIAICKKSKINYEFKK